MKKVAAFEFFCFCLEKIQVRGNIIEVCKIVHGLEKVFREKFFSPSFMTLELVHI